MAILSNRNLFSYWISCLLSNKNTVSNLEPLVALTVLVEVDRCLTSTFLYFNPPKITFTFYSPHLDHIEMLTIFANCFSHYLCDLFIDIDSVSLVCLILNFIRSDLTRKSVWLYHFVLKRFKYIENISYCSRTSILWLFLWHLFVKFSTFTLVTFQSIADQIHRIDCCLMN
ncbi:hypothetical protein SSS_08276 [Sarcoptes scabiei]|nr:hypothetical protein SSS_08276 [Sarcoptes scabiei]